MILLLAALRVTARVLLCFLIADLVVGFVHWLEDCYGQPDWPIVGKSVIEPNLIHHAEPRAFLANSWWGSADFQLVAGAAVIGGAALLGWFAWELVLVVFLAVNANEAHKWSHRTRAENGWLVNFLQKTKLVQSRAQHGHHHGGERNTHYCVITAWVNPLVERLHLWRGLELVVARCTGAQPRIDPAVAARKARAAAKAAA